MLVTANIPNLINGVSQQPPTLRLASQCEAQENFHASVSDGLRRRPATRYVAQLSATEWSDTFLHTIRRDIAERYLVAITGGQVKVFDLATGVEKTVNAPGGWGYLTGASKADLRATTSADYTFIVNRQKTPAMSSALTTARQNVAILHVAAGNYGKTYKVSINGALRATVTTPDGSTASDVYDVATNKIAGDIVAALTAKTPALSGFSYSQLGDIVVITSTGSSAFTVEVEDGTGGAGVVPIVSTVQRFSKLPTTAPDGFMVEVSGQGESNFDNYHVRFVAEGTSGVWEECPKGGETFAFDPLTMPHTLVREADGTFTFGPAQWDDRKVGDAELIPPPSFIGQALTDVFFFRNRLGFLSGENIILSTSGGFFNFWRATATTTLESDPIDLATTGAQVSILHYAVPFNQSLLLFSETAQFILQGGDVLSAETAFITQATEFESSTDTRPVGVGKHVYFAVPRGSFSAIREYFVDETGEQNDAVDITSHVPKLLPKGVFKLAASTAENILVALTAETPNALWVYNFFWGDQGKLQSAWSRWSLGPGEAILNADFLESDLLLVVAREDGTHLETMALESGALDEGASFPYMLDRGVILDGAAAGGTTTITLPYEVSETEQARVVVMSAAAGGSPPEGSVLTILDFPTANTIRLAGEHPEVPLIAGLRFTSRYTFSQLYVRSQNSTGAMVAVDDGRLQLRRMSLNYTETGAFEVTVSYTGREDSRKAYTGRVLGGVSALLGATALDTGRFSFPVLGRNSHVSITITADSPLPASFTSADWEASYETRARRI